MKDPDTNSTANQERSGTHAHRSPQPFDGLRVLDLTHVLAGPYATYQLALMGAHVLKIEEPVDGDMVRPTGGPADMRAADLGTSFQAQNANKSSVVLDLKQASGRAAAARLAAHADVVVVNYRTGALDAAGLDYETLSAENPSVIFCSMTGYGSQGPRAEYTAYDNVIQASSGLMTVNGTRDTRPVMIGAPLLDYGTGYAAAFAISAALLHRERTGEGQCIDLAMQDVALTLMSSAVVRYLNDDSFPVRDGNTGPNVAYGCHPTADGLLMIGAYSPKQSARLWRLLGEEDEARIVEALDVSALSERAARQIEILSKALPMCSAEDWVKRMQAVGVPAAKVVDLPEAIAETDAARPGLFGESPEQSDMPELHARVPVASFRFDHGGPALRRPPPRHGEQTQRVLELLEGDPRAAFDPNRNRS